MKSTQKGYKLIPTDSHVAFFFGNLKLAILLQQKTLLAQR